MYPVVRSSRPGIPLLRIPIMSTSRYCARSMSSCPGWRTASIAPMSTSSICCVSSLGTQDDVQEPQRHPARVVDRRTVEPFAFVAREERDDVPDVFERARAPGGNELADGYLEPLYPRRTEHPRERGRYNGAELEQVDAMTVRPELEREVTHVHLEGRLRRGNETAVVKQRIVEEVGQAEDSSAWREEIAIVKRPGPVHERMGEVVERLLELAGLERRAVAGEEMT